MPLGDVLQFLLQGTYVWHHLLQGFFSHVAFVSQHAEQKVDRRYAIVVQPFGFFLAEAKDVLHFRGELNHHLFFLNSVQMETFTNSVPIMSMCQPRTFA